MDELNGVRMARRIWVLFILLTIGFSSSAGWGQSGAVSVIPEDDMTSRTSTLIVTPHEMDLGILSPGEEAKGTFYLKSSGPGTVEWFMEVPKGWNLIDNQNLSDIVALNPVPLRVRLVYIKEVGRAKNRSAQMLLHMEAGGNAVDLKREIPVGNLQEQVRFNYDGGTATIVIKARLEEMPALPLLEVDPARLDLGVVRPGETITKRILLTNRGREQLKWKVGVAGSKGMPQTVQPPSGKYISLRNDSSAPGGQPREGLEWSGAWTEDGGYPSAKGEQNVLRYRFSGTGISLYYWKSPDGGNFNVYFDEQFVNIVDGFSERREKEELLIAEGQPDGPHTLTIVNGPGKVTLEGVRVSGRAIQKGPPRWISVFPDSGMTTRETDYINVSINTRQLSPGMYGDYVFFTSNGGDADVEIFLEVAAETASRLLNVHRYLAGSDYLYTTNPQAEASRLQAKGYRHTGVVFRLFMPGTPGTTDFFRWFNPSKGDHYYSYDPKGGKPLTGYLSEGAIGNIATSRLAGTRELYRWFHPGKGVHFYTTDPVGEGVDKKGYRFEGIAGFVR